MILSRCWQRSRGVHLTRPCKRQITTVGHDLSRPLQSYLSRSHDPYLNLSIEHHLLQKASPTSTILFLYVNRPCVVIGRNQNPWTEVNLGLLKQFQPADPGHSPGSARDQPYGSPGIELVRRRSGGGTVFHDFGNVNWTVICPADKFTRDNHAEMVVRGMRRLNVARCRVNERHDIVLDHGEESSSHKSEGEGGEWGPDDDSHSTPWTGTGSTVKVSGSAYKLTRGRALHHGTALLASENLKRIKEVLTAPGRGVIESKGVESVSSPVANIGIGNDAFIQTVQNEFARMYGSQEAKLVGEEWLDDAEVHKGRKELKSLDWTYCQTPRFTISNQKLHETGKTDMPFFKLDVRGGVAESIAMRNGSDTVLSGPLQENFRLKIHEIKEWREMLDQWTVKSDLSDSQKAGLAEWLQGMLPTARRRALRG